MFDRFIEWISKYPKLHVFYLTFIFFGLLVGWFVLVMPFVVFDAFKKDFIPYFDGLRDILKKGKKTKE